MRSITSFSVALLMSAAAFPALADDMKPSAQTQSFIEKAASSNEFEIQSSKLALQKSSNANVKAFAQQMIKDHEKAGKDLKNYVDEAKIDDDVIPTRMDARQAETLAQLNTAAGGNFDQQYIAAQKTAHKEAVSLFDDYAGGGDNSTIKDFAIKTLPTLKQHEAHVNKLSAR